MSTTSIVDPTRAHEEHIALETRQKHPIQNAQVFDMGNMAIASLPNIEAFARQTGAIQRSELSLIYNCHGLTFASRRTSVEEESDLRVILYSDDGYEEIAEPNVLQGDVIVYFGARNSIPHSGVVAGRPEPPLGLPLVFSKWGHAGEYLHWAPRLPEWLPFEKYKYFRVTK